MTKIVRTSLGLPTLRAGPQFQNSKPVLVIEYWNLRFLCYFSFGVPTLWAGAQFGAWSLGFCRLHYSSRLPQDRNIFGQLNKPGLSEVLRDSMKNYVF
jgi:hypothetical protein